MQSNHNHPHNQTNQTTGPSHVPKPHRPMQTISPIVKTAAHPAEAHKNSHPAHLNNTPDPDTAEPTDWPDTTASSAKEKDTALIRAKGKKAHYTPKIILTQSWELAVAMKTLKSLHHQHLRVLQRTI
ncbi:hypothetical protein OIU79_007045 [Salix purpurea]|uniref:Uncharacterized protein n=1 Tax=Salix purpurea TaxID=77065 RepID=A0A9Q0Z2W0_SALPP|nr:hypothetical protein OIU79_007045 [Salix purpurea]